MTTKVTAGVIAANAVNSAQIISGSIDTTHIASGQVTAAKIADNTITATKISASTSPTFGALNINGSLDINTSGAHLKFTRSSFDTLQFGTGTGNSISGLHLTNTTDSTVPFSIHENAPDASLTLSDGGGLSVGGETAAQSLSLYGNNHTYMGWYPTAGAGRKAYAGFGTANSSTFSIYNEAGGGDIALLAGGAIHLNVDGNVLLDSGTSSDIKFMNAGTETLRYSNSATGPQFFSPVSDKDIIFKGNDNGSTITALTLDISEGGDAYFNRRISVGGVITNTAANADDIVLGSYNDSTERGITIASTTGGGIRWNDAADAAVIQYAHSSNELYYSSTSHHRFVATTADAAGLVRINSSDAGAGVLHIKAADVTENGVGALDLQSPNSAMRIGGTNGRSWIQSHDSQPLYINKLGNNVILNADGSSVGIGTESPGGKLHVSAGSSASTTVQFGGSYDTYVKIGPITNTASGMLQFLNSSGTSMWSLGYRDTNASGTDGIFRIRRGATLDTAGPYFQLGTDGQAYLETTTQSESIYQLRIGTSVNANPSRANLGFTSGLGLLAKIEAEQRAGGSQPYGHLAFWTSDNGSLQQRMTLNYDGRLGIGLNHISPACLVHIYETNAQNDGLGLLQVEQANTTSGGSQTNASITAKNYHGTSQFMQWEENGLRLGSRITTNSGAGDLYFTTGNDNVKLTVPDSGAVTFNSNEIRINNSATYNITSGSSGSVIRGAAVRFLKMQDHRTPLYNSMTHGHMAFGFTSYALNNSSPWADIIYLNSYTDSSGGSPNAIVVSRSASNCKVVRYSWSNSSSTAINNGTQYALAGSTSSDQRLKENVVNITNGLDTIKALRPVTFNWTDEFLQAGLSKNETEIEADKNGTLIAPETKVENVGLIAQEVEEVLPTIIHENEISFGGTDYKTIHYDKLVPHLIAAIKEQDVVIQDLKSRIEALENGN